MSNTITSSLSAPQRLAAFEQDTRQYGKAGATLVGGARALADLAGATCTLSPQGRAAAAAAPDAAAAAGQGAGELAGELGQWVAAAGQALEELGGDVAEASRQVVAEAACAYGAVAGMAGRVSDLAAGAADAVVEGVADVADDVAGYALMLAAL